LKEPFPSPRSSSNPKSWVCSGFKPTGEQRRARTTRRVLRNLRERVKTFRRTEERKESIREIAASGDSDPVLVDLHGDVTAGVLRTPLPSNFWTTLGPPLEPKDEVSVDLPATKQAADSFNESNYKSSTQGTTSCIFPLVLNELPSEAQEIIETIEQGRRTKG
jgi:hypothetical protein